VIRSTGTKGAQPGTWAHAAEAKARWAARLARRAHRTADPEIRAEYRAQALEELARAVEYFSRSKLLGEGRRA